MTSVAELSLFPSTYRAELEALAASSRRVADMARTFPVLFHLLAVSAFEGDRRARVIAMIESGRPLSEVARVAALPLCLRRIPAAACLDPLPWPRWSDAANRQLSNLMIDSSADEIALWLDCVMFAAACGGEEFALWVARSFARLRGAAGSEATAADLREFLVPLAIYAWHSRADRGDIAWLAFQRFEPALAVDTVVCETRYFINRLKLLAYFGEAPLAPRWSAGARLGHYEIVPLNGFWGLMEERIDMRNCLDCYADKLAGNNSRVFGIRYKGRKVATIELGPSRTDADRPSIVQVKGPGNADVSLEIWHTAFTWLAEVRTGKGCAPERPVNYVDVGHRQLSLLLAPYLAAHPMMQRQWSAWGFGQLDNTLNRLAMRLGVGGWPFRLT